MQDLAPRHGFELEFTARKSKYLENAVHASKSSVYSALRLKLKEYVEGEPRLTLDRADRVTVKHLAEAVQ